MLKTPYPWFGGKVRVAPAVWARFGNVRNYVEPFLGGGAMLLSRPSWHKIASETVNDLDAFLTNFWRAVKADPEAVAHHADWPVNEVDLASRRDWLFSQTGHIEKMMTDPDWYDVKMAGTWVWGVCSTIGNAWKEKSTSLGGGSGVHRAGTYLSGGRGVHRASTHLGDAGVGVHQASANLNYGMGVHRTDALSMPGSEEGTRLANLLAFFDALSVRLDRVRVMCGDWTRVTSPSVTVHHGLTAMFLDPPYIDDCCVAYAHNTDVRGAVREYALAHGHEMRIALCGYEGEHEMPRDWEVYSWSTAGGYGNTGEGRGKVNRHRERIWFSPLCIKPGLMADIGDLDA